MTNTENSYPFLAVWDARDGLAPLAVTVLGEEIPNPLSGRTYLLICPDGGAAFFVPSDEVSPLV